MTAVRKAVELIDLDGGAFSFRHSSDSFVDHGKQGFAAKFALEGINGSNLDAIVGRLERKHNAVIVVEPNFFSLVGAVDDYST
jgi:hypothetical protein